METSRLRHFRMVVETQNLRRAAELLRISHSGLSKSLKALEAELGLTLVMPAGRGLVVTDDGLRVYARSEQVLRAVEALGDPEVTQPVVKVRLGTFEVFTSFFIGDLVREHFGDAEVEVHELVPGRLEEALLGSRIDIGITYEPVPRAGVDYTKVASVRMGTFVRHDAFADTPFAEIPFVVPVQPIDGTASGVRGSDAWPAERFPRRDVYRVDVLTTGLTLVRQGLCAVFMPEFVARLHDATVDAPYRLRELPRPTGMPAVNRDVYIVKRESTPETATMKKIARALRTLR